MDLQVKRKQGHPQPCGTALEQQLFAAVAVNKITDFFHQEERREEKDANFHFSGRIVFEVAFFSGAMSVIAFISWVRSIRQ